MNHENSNEITNNHIVHNGISNNSDDQLIIVENDEKLLGNGEQTVTNITHFESRDNKIISNGVHSHHYNSHSLITNGETQDNISHTSDSVLSLNLDDSESGSINLKPKKLFTLSLQSLLDKVKRKNGFSDNVNINSLTALILENRPSNLPAKPEYEQKKHKLEYEEIIRQARKKEIKDAKFRKKLFVRQRKQEEQVIESIRQWNDILPNWEKLKNSKSTRDLWWNGIPSLIRERVWYLAIGNELNLTEQVFEICVNRSKEKVWARNGMDGEVCDTSDLIKLDVSRTFAQLGLFQECGPYHDILRTILGAYVMYRPDIGYCQGMSFMAAMLLLNMESDQAFICFANLLNNQLLLSFFRVNQTMMNAYYQTYEEFFKENLPKLYKHFYEHNLTPDLYLVDYIYTLFSRSLPLDVASRVWDMFLRDGDQFIFRAALGILAMYCDALLSLDFIYLAQFLTKLPDDIDAEKLFASIASIRMVIASEKLSFADVLSNKVSNINSN